MPPLKLKCTHLLSSGLSHEDKGCDEDQHDLFMQLSYLEYFYYFLQNNEKIMFDAECKDGLALEFASEELKDNEVLVLAAVRQNGLALYYASEKLRNNREVVGSALANNRDALFAASNELQRELAKFFSYDNKIMFDAVCKDGLALQFASEELKDNKVFVLAAVRQNGLALYYASKKLRNNREVVVDALANNRHALYAASRALQYDLEKFFPFLSQLELFKNKAQKLKEQNYTGESECLLKLHDSLIQDFKNFKTIPYFKESCYNSLKEARTILRKGRNEKPVVTNMDLGHDTAFCLPVFSINRDKAGQFSFFKSAAVVRYIDDFKELVSKIN